MRQLRSLPKQKGHAWKGWKWLASLLVAIPVVTALIGAFTNVLPYIESAFHRPDADVSLGCPVPTDLADLVIPIVNSGDRDALITSAEVALRASNAAEQRGALELHAEPNYVYPINTIEAQARLQVTGIPRSSFLMLRQFVRDHRDHLTSCSVEISVATWRGFRRLVKDFGSGACATCGTFASELEKANPPGQ